MFLRHHAKMLLIPLLALVLVTVNVPVARAANISIVVNSLADTSGPCSTSGTGTCTLRDALTYANAQPDANLWNITFSVTGSVNLTSTLPSIQNNLTMNGSGQQVTLSGAGAYRILTVRRRGVLLITALTLANGNGAADCGGSYNCGGAIKSRGVLTVKGSILTNNNGDWYGGAIDNEGPMLTVENSVFSNNATSNFYGLGSAIYNASGDLQITNSQFNGNTAFQGGALYHNVGALTIDSTTFSSNSADQGGAIQSSGTAAITNTTFSGNNLGSSADGTEGGAIYNSGTLRVSNSTFSNNSTCPLCFGGAIANYGGNARVKNSTLTGNYAQYGGAIYNDSAGTFRLVSSTVTDNKGWEGGGGIYNNSSTLTITNSTLTENHAPAGNGGALYNLDGTVNVTNSSIWSNHAFPSAFDAGGIYNDGNAVTLRNTIVANNSNYQCYDYAESLKADSYNLDDDGSCNNATQKKASEIALGSLKDNGGPTQTLKPSSKSAAINAGDNAICAAAIGSPSYGAGGVDQRGVKRPQGQNCDVGAYELRNN